jgi:hypothetical protein
MGVKISSLSKFGITAERIFETMSNQESDIDKHSNYALPANFSLRYSKFKCTAGAATQHKDFLQF